MTIRFRVTPAMLFGAQRAAMRQIRWMHLGGYFVVVLFPLLMIGITLAYGGTVLGALRSNALMIIGVPIFWLVGIPLMLRATAARTLRGTPGLQGELQYAVSDSGLDMQSDVARSHLAWPAFTKATENREFLLLFQNKRMAIFLPKTAFPSSGELEAFKQLLVDKLPGRTALVP